LADVADSEAHDREDREETPDEVVEKLRSALAELEDAKRRVQRDAERKASELRERVLEELLPVLDNLDRSLDAGPRTRNLDALLQGMRLVRDQFLGVLSHFGLERVSAVGQRFDPSAHDAVAVQPVTDPNQDGVVLSELEPAYKLGDKIIRHARVTVGRSASRPPS
jgi:molecular chaperone GrpE